MLITSVRITMPPVYMAVTATLLATSPERARSR
jgi:hypothetical protein